MSKRLAILIGILAALSLVGGAAFTFRSAIRDRIAVATKPGLPPAKPYVPEPDAPAPVPAPSPTATQPKAPAPAPSNLPAEANLEVPFTSQAPKADWSQPYQDACEEASLIMDNGYLKDAASFTADDADRQILALVDWEMKTFGYYKDTTAEEVARMAREYFGFAGSEAIGISSMDDIKKQVAAGRPVLVPAAGRLLDNPYFTPPGPLYHMLVIKGYLKDGRIITNDPGTRRGADYLYDPQVLFDAIHDWNGGDVVHGRKVMIIMEK